MGDEPRPVMSLLGSRDQHPEQRCCWVTETNTQTHDIIREGLDRSPLLAGRLKALAPDTVRALKIRFTALLTKTRIKFLLSLKG